MKTQGLPAEERRRLIAKIHIAKKQLRLSDEDYKALLGSVTNGKSSCKDMSDSELVAVIEAAEGRGFKPKSTKGKLSPATRQKPKDSKTAADKIRALWIECFKAGKVKSRYEEALQAFCKSITDVDRVEWLNYRQSKRIIKILEDRLNGAEGSKRTDIEDSGIASGAPSGANIPQGSELAEPSRETLSGKH